ncbi:CDC50 family protein-like protein [Morchella snyderi]|nr:CDC50 family protein-like protein [Morchella snyderi]
MSKACVGALSREPACLHLLQPTSQSQPHPNPAIIEIPQQMTDTSTMAVDSSGGARNGDYSPLDSQEPAKTMRPKDTAWLQQRTKAWSPLITAPWTIPIFFVLATIFAPIGGFLLFASAQVQELTIDYTDCLASANDAMSPIPRSSFSTHFHTPLTPANLETYRWRASPATKTCTLQFTIPSNLTPPVLFRYKLTNFHTNHRRFVMSLDRPQLMGEARTLQQLREPSGTNLRCNPLYADSAGTPYYPCGEIANSMFNDTFHAPVRASDGRAYPTTSRGIAWPQDRALYRPTAYAPGDVVPPPFWAEAFPQGYNSSNMPNLQDWEEFHVWMRPAGLATFSRLARRNDADVMGAGVWLMNVTSRFRTLGYGGRKALVVSTSGVMGGRGAGLGWAYVLASVVCAVLGVGMTARVAGAPRQLGDEAYLSWNRPDCYVVRDASECRSLWERWVNYCHRNGFP